MSPSFSESLNPVHTLRDFLDYFLGVLPRVVEFLSTILLILLGSATKPCLLPLMDLHELELPIVEFLSQFHVESEMTAVRGAKS